VSHRIPDVGNPWLDAGIVPYSTFHYRTDEDYWRDWFPADFITESFPGQFRNWFYSMLAMSTVLQNTAPFKTVLGYAIAKDQHGREMHKSWGNLIAFDEAADRAGADVMRWLFSLHQPEQNLNFGWESLDDVKRRLLVLWNTYSFFVTYAKVDGWTPKDEATPLEQRSMLDRWVIGRLHEVIGQVRSGLDDFDATSPAKSIDSFIEELSTWYVRRSRRRFWRSEGDADKSAAYATLYECLTQLTRLTAPFMPFLTENMYQNLVAQAQTGSPESVHLSDFPEQDVAAVDQDLLLSMRAAQQVVALGRAARDAASLKVRQPLGRIIVKAPTPALTQALRSVSDIITEELNVKELVFAEEGDDFVEYRVLPNLPVLGPRYGKLVPAIRTALAAQDAAEVVATVERGEPFVLPVDGQNIQLAPSDVLPSVTQREGFAAMAGDGFVIALDTQITPELRSEGMARDVVRHVNQWRKAAGLRVEDRIRLRYEGSPAVAQAIESNRDYIGAETLATAIEGGNVATGGFQAEATIGNESLKVGIDKV
jgi:isoleucyl-tRNA synthetase